MRPVFPLIEMQAFMENDRSAQRNGDGTLWERRRG